MEDIAPAWQSFVSTLLRELQKFSSEVQSASGGCSDTEISYLPRYLEQTRKMAPAEALRFMSEKIEWAIGEPDSSWGMVAPGSSTPPPKTDSLYDVLIEKSSDVALGVLGNGLYDLARTFISSVPNRSDIPLSEDQLVVNARYSLNLKYGLGLQPSDDPVEVQFRSSDWTVGFLSGNRISVATGSSFLGGGPIDHGYKTVHLVPGTLPTPATP